MLGITIGNKNIRLDSRQFHGVPLAHCWKSYRLSNVRGRRLLNIKCEYDRGKCYRRPPKPRMENPRLAVKLDSSGIRSQSPTGRNKKRKARGKVREPVLAAAVAIQRRKKKAKKKKAALCQEKEAFVERMMEKHSLNTGEAQLALLVDLGLSASNVSKLLRTRAEILLHRPSTIKKKLQFFHDVVGLSKDELKKLLVKFPRILEYNSRTTVRPRLKFLQSMGLQMEDMPKIFVHAPAVMELSVEKTLIPRLNFLQDTMGVPKESLRTVLVRHPQLITYSEEAMAERMEFMQSFGLCDERLTKAIISHPQVLHYSISGMSSRIEYFRSIGVSESALPKMISQIPQLLCLNIQVNLAPKVEFLRDELGCTNKALEANPTFLALSLEKRIIPRFEFMKIKCLKGVQRPIPMNWFKCSDRVFAESLAGAPLEEFMAFKASMMPS